MLYQSPPKQRSAAFKYRPKLFWTFLLISFAGLNYNFSYATTPSNKDLQARFKDWSVFKSNRGDDVICYAVSIPIKENGNFLFRGEPYLMVTNLVNDSDEVSVSSGFIYKQTADVELSFGSKKFYLFPYEALAWADDNNDDIDIIKEMQRNEEVTITGTMRDNKTASDTYSLIGFAKAYAKLKEICK